MRGYNISLYLSIYLSNLSTKETIELAVNLIFKKYQKTGKAKKQVTTLFDFVTSGTPFLFYEKYYDLKLQRPLH